MDRPDQKRRPSSSSSDGNLQKKAKLETPKKTISGLGGSSLVGTDSFLKSMDSIIFAVKSGKPPSTPRSESKSIEQTPKRIASSTPRVVPVKSTPIASTSQQTLSQKSLSKIEFKPITPRTTNKKRRPPDNMMKKDGTSAKSSPSAKSKLLDNYLASEKPKSTNPVIAVVKKTQENAEKTKLQESLQSKNTLSAQDKNKKTTSDTSIGLHEKKHSSPKQQYKPKLPVKDKRTGNQQATQGEVYLAGSKTCASAKVNSVNDVVKSSDVSFKRDNVASLPGGTSQKGKLGNPAKIILTSNEKSSTVIMNPNNAVSSPVSKVGTLASKDIIPSSQSDKTNDSIKDVQPEGCKTNADKNSKKTLEGTLESKMVTEIESGKTVENVGDDKINTSLVSTNESDNKIDTSLVSTNVGDNKIDTSLVSTNVSDNKIDTSLVSTNVSDNKIDTSLVLTNVSDSISEFIDNHKKLDDHSTKKRTRGRKANNLNGEGKCERDDNRVNTDKKKVIIKVNDSDSIKEFVDITKQPDLKPGRAKVHRGKRSHFDDDVIDSTDTVKNSNGNKPKKDADSTESLVKVAKAKAPRTSLRNNKNTSKNIENGENEIKGVDIGNAFQLEGDDFTTSTPVRARSSKRTHVTRRASFNKEEDKIMSDNVKTDVGNNKGESFLEDVDVRLSTPTSEQGCVDKSLKRKRGRPRKKAANENLTNDSMTNENVSKEGDPDKEDITFTKDYNLELTKNKAVLENNMKSKHTKMATSKQVKVVNNNAKKEKSVKPLKYSDSESVYSEKGEVLEGCKQTEIESVEKEQEELPTVTKAIDYDNLESNDPSLLVGCSMVNQTVNYICKLCEQKLTAMADDRAFPMWSFTYTSWTLFTSHMGSVHNLSDEYLQPIHFEKSQGGVKLIEDEGGGSEQEEPEESDEKNPNLDETDQKTKKKKSGNEKTESDHEKDRNMKKNKKYVKEKVGVCDEALVKLEEEVTGPRKRRSAAVRAVSRWKEAADQGKAIKKAEREMYRKPRYYKPTDLIKLPDNVATKLKRLKPGRPKLKCPHIERGCTNTKEYQHVAAMNYHLKICSFGKRSMIYNGYECAKCGKKIPKEKPMIKHCKAHEWSDGESGDSVSESDDDFINDSDADPDIDITREEWRNREHAALDAEVEDEDSEEFDGESRSSGDEEEEGQSVRCFCFPCLVELVERRREEDEYSGRTMKRHTLTFFKSEAQDHHSPYMKDLGTILKNLESEIVLSPGSARPDFSILDGTFKWTLDFVEEHERRDLYPELRCERQDLVDLDQSEIDLYVPNIKTSIPFACCNGRKQTPSMQTLSLFESVAHQKCTYTTYVGGPIWAMAWCPTPLTSQSANQYLAVYCHRNSEQVCPLAAATGGKTLLQIWDFGTLRNGESTSPRLAYCIALDVGAVWEMKWCPTGCYDDDEKDAEISTTEKDAEYSEQVGRIGILALACSSGCVQVFSVPKPSSIMKKEEEAGIRVLRPLKHWRLSPTRCAVPAVSCLGLDWAWKEGCAEVAACFSDGSFSVWNLNTKSALLTHRDSSGNLVQLPYASVQAHTSPVHGIKFCQRIPHYVYTAGADRDLRMWDLRSPDVSVDAMYKSLASCLVTPLNWMISIVGFQDVFSWCKTAVQVLDNGYLERDSFPLFGVLSCSNSLSFNNWHNACVVGTSAGEVLLNYCHFLIHLHKTRKAHTLRRLRLFSSHLQEIPLGDYKTIKQEKQNDDEKSDSVPVNIDRLVDSEKNNSGEKSDIQKGASISSSQNNNNKENDGDNTEYSSKNVKDKNNADLLSSLGSDNTNLELEEVGEEDLRNLGSVVNDAVFIVGKSGEECVDGVDSDRKEPKTGFGVVFTDSKLNKLSDIASCPRARGFTDTYKDSTSITGCSQHSVNRVCWNPNLGSEQWLAVGCNSGLLRLRCVTALQSDHTARVTAKFRKKHTQVKTEADEES